MQLSARCSNCLVAQLIGAEAAGQLVLLLCSLQPALSPEQYLSLGLQMQQCFQQLKQALYTDQLLVKYFDVHMAVQRGEPLDAVVSSLQQLFGSLSGSK